MTGEDDCLRTALTAAAASEFEVARTAKAVPGRCLPAETARSGTFVRRFGGASDGMSGTVRARGAGELGRITGLDFLLFVAGTRPTEAERVIAGAAAGVVAARRIGVDGRVAAALELEFEVLEGA